MTVSPIPALPGQQIGSGGFGDVFLHVDRLGYLIKRFKSPLVGRDADNLRSLISTFRSLRPSEQSFIRSRFSWPIEAYGEGDSITGYLMPQAPSGAYFQLVAAGRSSRPLLQAKFLLDGQYFRSQSISSPPPTVSLTNRLEIAVDLLRSIAFLHALDLVYLDVSSNNVCVQLSETARVFMLDSDSIRSPSEDGAPPPVTPDWAVNATLGLKEIDRAKCALFIWRLFTQYPTLDPSIGDVQLVDDRAGCEIGAHLLELWQSGAEDLADELTRVLWAAMGRNSVGRAIAHDLRDQYARLALFWEDAPMYPEDIDLLRRARHFCTLEATITKAVGFERRLCRRRLRQNREFTIDLPPLDAISPAPSSIDELERLTLSNGYVDIARALATATLGDLERHGWVERATRHALLTEATIEPSVTANLDRVVVSWSWPELEWVSAAQLEVAVGQQWHAEIVDRPLDSSVVTREIYTPPSSDVRLRLFPAVKSSSGVVVTSPSPSVASYRSADAMQRPDIVTGRRFHIDGSARGDSFDIEIIDPERERIEQARRRRKRRQELALRVVAVTASIVLLAIPVWWFFSRDTSNPRLVDRADGRHLSWRFTDDAPADDVVGVAIEKSIDGGFSWRRTQVLDPKFNGIRFRYQSGSDETLVRVVALYASEERVIGAEALLSAIGQPTTVSGLAVRYAEGAYEVRWKSPSDPGGLPIDQYHIDSGIRLTDGTIAWRRLSSVSSSGESDEERRHRHVAKNSNYIFRVRAVNLAGEFGPWSVWLND